MTAKPSGFTGVSLAGWLTTQLLQAFFSVNSTGYTVLLSESDRFNSISLSL